MKINRIKPGIMIRKSMYISLLSLFGVAGFSQTPVTLDECRKEALENNKRIQSSVLEVQKAEASVRKPEQLTCLLLTGVLMPCIFPTWKN
jgi:hypothetical protein